MVIPFIFMFRMTYRLRLCSLKILFKEDKVVQISIRYEKKEQTFQIPRHICLLLCCLVIKISISFCIPRELPFSQYTYFWQVYYDVTESFHLNRFMLSAICFYMVRSHKTIIEKWFQNANAGSILEICSNSTKTFLPFRSKK